MRRLDCKQVVAELSNYLDGEVSPELMQALEQHLGKCHRCSVVFDTTRQTLNIVTECGPFEVPADVSTRVFSHLRKRLGWA